MPRATSFDCVCWPKAMMACNARRHPTVYAAQRQRWHATPDVVRPCLPSKGDDGMPCLTPSNCVSLFKGDDGMPRLTSFDRMCCPKAMMLCHA